MSVGYHPADPIAVLLNAVLSMTIKWQLRGERAVRECGVPYTVVRPGNLLDTPRPRGSVVLVGHGDAKVPAGKVSRDDVAEVISVATFAKNCQNATVGVAGAPAPTGGIASQMAWDPARGMHYVAVEHEERVREGDDVAAMLEGVAGGRRRAAGAATFSIRSRVRRGAVRGGDAGDGGARRGGARAVEAVR